MAINKRRENNTKNAEIAEIPNKSGETRLKKRQKNARKTEFKLDTREGTDPPSSVIEASWGSNANGGGGKWGRERSLPPLPPSPSWSLGNPAPPASFFLTAVYEWNLSRLEGNILPPLLTYRNRQN